MKVLVNGESFEVELIKQETQSVTFLLNGRNYEVSFEKSVPSSKKHIKSKSLNKIESSNLSIDSNKKIIAPLFGIVSSVNVSIGQEVSAGDILIRIEAMKMQNNIYATYTGKIKSVFVTTGDEVSHGQVLIELE